MEKNNKILTIKQFIGIFFFNLREKKTIAIYIDMNLLINFSINF